MKTALSLKKVITPWKGLPPEDKLQNYFGFVYLITNLTNNKKYIGRKYLWKTIKKKLKDKKRAVKSIVESDWRTYKSSCIDLKKDIEKLGIENFSFEAIVVCDTRSKTNYYEVQKQFEFDVLNAKLMNEYEYYNTNILSRYFRGRV